MNREIKFRAWDDKDKEMRNWEDLIIEKDKGSEQFSVGYKFNPWITNYDHKHELMQYTGLKDCNGFEIYEGDIVQFNDDPSDIYCVCFGEFGVPNIEEQGYQDMSVGFYFKPEHNLKDVEPFNMTIPVNTTYSTDVKILGNIHENPELLQGGN